MGSEVRVSLGGRALCVGVCVCEREKDRKSAVGKINISSHQVFI